MIISKPALVLVVMAIPFAVAFADTASSVSSLQQQLFQQINSLLHTKPNFSLEFSKKQITEYSLIGAIALVVVIVIASSARKTKKKTS